MSKHKPHLIGHEYAAMVFDGSTVTEVAKARGVSHVAVIQGLANAGYPTAREIRQQRQKAVSELISAAIACEASLQHLGGRLHAERLAAALKPFKACTGVSA